MKRTTVATTAGLTLLGITMATLPNSAVAQTPCSLPVSAFLTDPEGDPLHGSIDVELQFFVDPADGASPSECRSYASVGVDRGWLRIDVDACAEPAPDGCGAVAVADILRSAPGLWVGVLVDGIEIGPRIAAGAVPYAVEASNARTLQGLDPDAFERAGSVESHAADPDAHHSATSDGVDITPASVEVGGTRVEPGSVDLGPDATDVLTAEIVQTLTGGGEADALHGHAASGGGGGCYVAVGMNTCAPEYGVAYSGVYVSQIVSYSSVAASPACFADSGIESISPASSSGISHLYMTGHSGARQYVVPLDDAVPCAVCCR